MPFSKMTPLEQVVEKLVDTERMFDTANLQIAKGILQPTVKFAKEQLLAEKMMVSENFQKGYSQGVTAGKLEASITKI